PGAAELRTFMPVGGIAFFLLDNISPIGQFWKTDGTSAGTQLVMPFSFVSVYSQASFHGLLYMSVDACTPQCSLQIWKSDGTVAGTQPVIPMPAMNLTVVNDTLFFTSGDQTLGSELWASDGTLAGTHLVKDINPGMASSSPGALIGLN